MKILIPFGMAFAGLIMLTLLPEKTTLTTLVAIGMMVAGTASVLYTIKRS